MRAEEPELLLTQEERAARDVVERAARAIDRLDRRIDKQTTVHAKTRGCQQNPVAGDGNHVLPDRLCRPGTVS